MPQNSRTTIVGFVAFFLKEFQFLTLEFKGERDGVVGTAYPWTAQLEKLGPVLCDTNFPPQCCDLRWCLHSLNPDYGPITKQTELALPTQKTLSTHSCRTQLSALFKKL